jgi:3-deoxy-manno-octulosonate cytidylyltransferase (CMP-KDO synthetase)
VSPVRKRSINNDRKTCDKNPQVSDLAPRHSGSNGVKVLAVIPARYGSTRFAAKVLAKDTGKFLIQHAYERACLAKLPQKVIIAADDQRIVDAAKTFGAECILTSPEHTSGTDRIAEAIKKLSAERCPLNADDIVVNLQADEPEIDPKNIDYLAELLIENPDYPMATLAADFQNAEQITDPNIVKVITAAYGRRTTDDGRLTSHERTGGSVKRSLAMAIPKAFGFEAATQRRTSDEIGRAIYFSRSPIPYDRETDGIGDVEQYLRHIGIYAYRKEFLLKITTLPQTPLERIEKLEQLRAIENGFDILVGKVQHTCDGIDTPEQYAEFVERYQKKTN